jgi:hypothetical protein
MLSTSSLAQMISLVCVIYLLLMLVITLQHPSLTIPPQYHSRQGVLDEPFVVESSHWVTNSCIGGGECFCEEPWAGVNCDQRMFVLSS